MIDLWILKTWMTSGQRWLNSKNLGIILGENVEVKMKSQNEKSK